MQNACSALTLLDASIMPSTGTDFRSRSFAFACDIVRLYRVLERSVPGPMARQVLRAGTSIGANLEEAKVAQSRRDLAARFTIALKEARETGYWLRLLQATALARPEVVVPILRETEELIAILTKSVHRLRNQ